MGRDSPHRLPGFLRKMPGLWQFPPMVVSARMEFWWQGSKPLSQTQLLPCFLWNSSFKRTVTRAFFRKHQNGRHQAKRPTHLDPVPEDLKGSGCPPLLDLLQHSVWITSGYTPSFSRPRAWRLVGCFILFVVILFHFLVTSWWEPGRVTCIYNRSSGKMGSLGFTGQPL